MSTFEDQSKQRKKQPKKIFSINEPDQQSDDNEEHKIDGEVFIIEVDNSASRAPKLHTRGKWQRGARLAESAVVHNPKITKHETIDENSAVLPTSNRESTVERPSAVPLLVKVNGDAGITNQGNRSRELWQMAFKKITEGDTTKSARTSKSDMSEFENPRSIIPTKGEKVELEKLEGFDLKYTSGRRFCGMYTPTMSTAFDPKSAEDLYQRYVFRERLGSVLTIAIIELIMRVISIGLIIGIAGRWEHVSCWLLALTSLLDTAAIILIVRARATERKAPFRLLQLASFAVYISMLLIIVGIMFVPYAVSIYTSDITFVGWYLIYAIFTCYTMLAVREDHALYGAVLITLLHLGARIFTLEPSTNWKCEIAAVTLLYFGTHVVGVFNRYLVERAQRETFMETRRLFRHCLKHEREYQNQHRLILSAIPRFIALKMVSDASTNDDCEDKPGSMQSSKKYIHRFNNVSMLYADIKGFTELSTVLSAEQLVKTLNDLFAEFDRNAEKHGCLRIRILGDCYYCVSGLPEASRADHASCCVKMGLSMIETIKETRAHTKKNVDMRIGIHTGAVLTGVLGLRKFQFDIFSTDTVIANNMESSGMAGKCHISQATYDHLSYEYDVEPGTPNQFLEDHGIETYFVKPQTDIEYLSTTEKSSNALNDISTMSLLPLPLTPIMHRHSDFEEVSRRLEISIRNGTHTAIGKNKIQKRTVTFEENRLEVEFRRLHDEFFKTNLAIALFLGLLLIICQFLIRPYNELSVIVYIGVGIYLIFATISLLITLGDRKGNPDWIVQAAKKLNRSQSQRHVVIFSAIFINTFIGLSGAMTCTGMENYSVECINNTLDFISMNSTPPSYPGTICETPQFLELYGLMVLLSCAAFLRFYHLLRLGTLTGITTVFSIMMMFTYRRLFFDWEARISGNSIGNCSDEENVPQMVINLLVMILLALTQFFEGRQNDWTTRMDYLRKIQAKREIADMEDLKKQTYMLLMNMLPEHVADHFLNRPPDSDDLYSKSYDQSSVIFASIPGFSKYFQQSEEIDGQGLECLRMLNEIISSIDELLNQERFHCIEKIKTIGATYMACAGLSPEAEIEDSVNNLCSTAHFALALKILVGQFNKRYEQSFAMRIGLAYGGPVIAGVIGSKKPQYDIWGKIVNLSSRMDTTGEEGKIQCTTEVKVPLQKKGFNFQERGETYVKGFKNKINTYWLTGCSAAAIQYHGKPSVTKKQSMNLAKLVFDVCKKKVDD